MKNIRQFFKQVLVVVVAIFVSLFLFVGISALSLQPSSPKITSKTVLRITLHGKVVERPPSEFSQLLAGQQEREIDFFALKKAIQEAQADKNIQGIYLASEDLQAGWAGLEEIRAALLAFKNAGKFIVAYGEHYTQKTYYLASLADDIVLHPGGIFDFKGLSKTVVFYKALLNKLEITPQIFRVGEYKSFVEPFIRQEMSPASKLT